MKRYAGAGLLVFVMMLGVVLAAGTSEPEDATAAETSAVTHFDLEPSTDNGSGAAYCGTSDPNPSLYYGGGWWGGWYEDHFFEKWARDHYHDWYFPDPFTYFAYAWCATEFGPAL